MVLGGEVNGGRILGTHPHTYSPEWEYNTGKLQKHKRSLSLSIPLTTVLGSFVLYSGRGAWIPTLPNEAMWLGLSQWFGIQERDDLSYVLPNMNNFGCRLYSETDIYRDGMGKFMLYQILFILALLTHFGIMPISGKLWGCGGDVM